MNRMLMLAAVLGLASSAGGCCCFSNWFRQPTAPVASAYPPAPAACDPCTTAPVTYGTAAPVLPYTPPPQL